MKKFLSFLSAVLVFITLLTSATMAMAADEVQTVRDEWFQEVKKSVAKDFHACVDFYTTQYDWVGWARWNDDSYIIIFQNEKMRAVDNGIWGNDGPGISFMNIKGFNGKAVHALAEARPGYGFGVSREKYRPWTFNFFRTNRENIDPNDFRFHPAACY